MTNYYREWISSLFNGNHFSSIICRNVGLSMGKTYKKIRMPKWVELRSPNTRMLKVSFGSLKQSADYNFRLEFLIPPSLGRLKATCDTRSFYFYYTLEQL